MRILFCNYEYPPLGGGGGVMNAMLAQELATRHDVTVLTSQGLDMPHRSVENGVNVVRVPVLFRKERSAATLLSMLLYIPLGIYHGRRLLEKEPHDLVNTHFVLPSGPVGDFLARTYQMPNLLTIHGGDLFDPSKRTSPHRHPLLRQWIQRLLRRADTVIGQSTNTLENMRAFYTPEIQGLRIPLGIRKPEASPAPRQLYNFRKDDILLVTVGRLIARKAVHQLIELMARLRGQSVHLLVIGSGPEAETLSQQVTALQLEKQVRFLGYVEEHEKQRLLKMSDIYVSTSQHEGFCLAFLEAMAAGLPVVSYDHGGQTDFLEDRLTGYLVPLNDLDTFTARVLSLVGQAGLRRKIAAENMARVSQYYLEYCAARYEEAFSNAIGRLSPERGAPFVRTQPIP